MFLSTLHCISILGSFYLLLLLTYTYEYRIYVCCKEGVISIFGGLGLVAGMLSVGCGRDLGGGLVSQG